MSFVDLLFLKNRENVAQIFVRITSPGRFIYTHFMKEVPHKIVISVSGQRGDAALWKAYDKYHL